MRYDAKTLMGIVGAIALLTGVSAGVEAQTGNQGMPGQNQQAPEIDPGSEEFTRFAQALSEVEEIQQEVNEEVQSLISESPLDEQRFQQIHQQAQGPGGGEGSADVSQAEQSQYENLLENIQTVQQSSQEDMIAEVESVDLSVERFNELIVAVQNDQELRQRLEELQS